MQYRKTLFSTSWVLGVLCPLLFGRACHRPIVRWQVRKLISQLTERLPPGGVMLSIFREKNARK